MGFLNEFGELEKRSSVSSTNLGSLRRGIRVSEIIWGYEGEESSFLQSFGALKERNSVFSNNLGC